MSNEEYQEHFGEAESEESQAPYVFVCENATELPVKFSITGDHKIWNLDKDQHNSAKQALFLDL